MFTMYLFYLKQKTYVDIYMVEQNIFEHSLDSLFLFKTSKQI